MCSELAGNFCLVSFICKHFGFYGIVQIICTQLHMGALLSNLCSICFCIMPTDCAGCHLGDPTPVHLLAVEAAGAGRPTV